MAYRPQLGAEPPAFPLRVNVLSEDTLAADGLRAALQGDPRLACVADVREAEVVVWDLGPNPGELPSADKLAAAGVRVGEQAVLVLVADEALAAAALALGASGVLRRRAHSPTLSAAVIALRLGLCVLDASFAEQYLELPKPPLEAAEQAGVDSLTQRELEVLEALALGLSNRAIAERLGVSVHTVKFHVNGILAKLEVDSRAGAVAKALRRGLLRT